MDLAVACSWKEQRENGGRGKRSEKVPQIPKTILNTTPTCNRKKKNISQTKLKLINKPIAFGHFLNMYNFIYYLTSNIY